MSITRGHVLTISILYGTFTTQAVCLADEDAPCRTRTGCPEPTPCQPNGDGHLVDREGKWCSHENTHGRDCYLVKALHADLARSYQGDPALLAALPIHITPATVGRDRDGMFQLEPAGAAWSLAPTNGDTL